MNYLPNDNAENVSQFNFNPNHIEVCQVKAWSNNYDNANIYALKAV